MALQIRYGTDAEWESGNNNILSGEMGIATDTERAFIGTETGYMEMVNIKHLAPQYDPDTEYAPNYFIVKDGKLYRSKNYTTGVWDSSDWEVSSIGEAMNIIVMSNVES